jgi:hypothetical protein
MMSRIPGIQNVEHFPQPETLPNTNFDGDNCYKLFIQSIRASRIRALMLGYSDLSFGGSGVNVKGSVDAKEFMNPSEPQNIYLHYGQEKHFIGRVIPEAVHLQTLKSEAQLSDELVALINAFYLLPNYEFDV